MTKSVEESVAARQRDGFGYVRRLKMQRAEWRLSVVDRD